MRNVSGRALEVLESSNANPDDITALSAAPLAAGAPGTVGEAVVEAVAKIRENIVLRRAMKLAVKPGAGVVSAYVPASVPPCPHTF